MNPQFAGQATRVIRIDIALRTVFEREGFANPKCLVNRVITTRRCLSSGDTVINVSF